MFNLSDKDLDRLSQEAAQQHEPGDIVGPKFWDKLEARLDRDLGKVNPNPARGIRRLPYYYAPAVLVLLGITYYLVRINSSSRKGTSSGSPPLTVVSPSPAEPLKSNSSTQNPVPSNNSTSTPSAPSNTVEYPVAASATPHGGGTSGSSNAGATAASPAGHVATPSGAGNNSAIGSQTANRDRSPGGRHRHSRPIGSDADKTDLNSAGSPAATTGSPTNGSNAEPGSTTAIGNTTTNGSTTTRSQRDLTYSAVRGPVRLARKPFIDDSALLALDLRNIRQPIHKQALHINRSLVLGIMGGPDFSSVSSIAPSGPGSNIGITADYQLLNHFYIGTGLILTRKNFAAAPQSYHVPADYYRQNITMGGGDVDYIKGTFNMLDLPLNLRYDFTTSGNTLIFLSAGTSSYFFTQQSCGYYFNWYNTRNISEKQVSYSDHPSNLFASLDLSLGAEFGLTNSLSSLVSVYWKVPTHGLGFGQVDVTSVGLNFALRFAPVLSRTRR
jgi:hypothetical protein